jgi:nucleolar protein 4
MLKRLAIHAVRAFETEVKNGARTALSEDELAEPVPDDDNTAADVRRGTHMKKHGRNTGVKQTKIVRQQDRIDSVTGKGRSKGYGFLELEKHADALRVLRWANNNLEVGKLFAEWWKEELEDLVKAEKKKEKTEEGRIERLKQEIENGPEKKPRGSLIVEFSIENIQVVKRRVAHQQEQGTVRGEHMLMIHKLTYTAACRRREESTKKVDIN